MRLSIFSLCAAGLASFMLANADLAPLASAPPPCQQQSELTCVLEASWQAALVLPDEKKERMAQLIYDTAEELGDAETTKVIARRVNAASSKQQARSKTVYPDYGWQMAEPILAARGVSGLINDARKPQSSGLFAPADALLSAAKHLLPDAPDNAAKINAALLELIPSASAFEKPAFAHAAAELAMVRCDLSLFDRAARLTDAPKSLRYSMWRARISGNALSLLDRIRSDADEEDTRHVRQVLDGYREIATRGYCPASTG